MISNEEIKDVIQESEMFHMELMNDSQKMFKLQLKTNVSTIKYSNNLQSLENGLINIGYELSKKLIFLEK